MGKDLFWLRRAVRCIVYILGNIKCSRALVVGVSMSVLKKALGYISFVVHGDMPSTISRGSNPSPTLIEIWNSIFITAKETKKTTTGIYFSNQRSASNHINSHPLSTRLQFLFVDLFYAG